MNILSISFALEDYCYGDGEAEEGGVEEVGDDADGADAGEAGSHEQLGAVGKDSLDAATSGIQEAGAAARVDVKFLGYALGDVTDGEDGDGVVRCTYIGEGHQAADAPFGSCAPFDVPRHSIDDKIESTDIFEDGEDAACEHGDEDEFAHSHDTLRGAVDPAHEVIAAVEDAGEACEDITGGEHDEYIDAASRADEDGSIWEYLPYG